MPHITWRGAISFGLVHAPVKLYPATAHARVSFDLLDARTLDPVGYRKFNKVNGKRVDAENLIRGVEYEKGRYVVLSDEEIRAANVESSRLLEILAFVDAPELSFLYLDTPYFLEPDKGGEKVYALLREAMRRAGKIGIAQIVMHGKQHLAAMVPAGPVLALNTLRWADEVRDLSGLELPAEDPKEAGLSSKEIDMAERLIEDMSEGWHPEAYRDTFHDDIMELVRRKVAAGKSTEIGSEAVSEKPEPRSADLLDLSDLLRRSLGGRRKGGEPRETPRRSGARAPERAAARRPRRKSA